jgi:hypothetical protein
VLRLRSARNLLFSLEGRLNDLPLRASNEGLLRPRVARAHPNSLHPSLGERPRLPFTARNFLTRPTPIAPRRALVPGEHILIVRVPRARMAPGHSSPSFQSRSPISSRVAWLILDCARPISPLEGGLDGLPLRVSNEGLLRPRVARAQETV